MCASKVPWELYIASIVCILAEKLLNFNILLYHLQTMRSTPERVHLRNVRWSTAGRYRCEVTAEDFETASKSVEASVVGMGVTQNSKFYFVS